MQALIRGFLSRTVIKSLRKAIKVKKKYFLEEEFWETISKTSKYIPKS
jgi:hypothetical protein